MSVFDSSDGVPDGRRVRAALLRKVCGDAAMFALGSAVARVVDMASSDDRGTNELAQYVLSDVALTQRILRLANTVRYRTANGTAVSTISRAISLLGFDNVKTAALGMLLVDALDSSEHAESVHIELEAALCASLAGREMARHSAYRGAEEAGIAALFKNLGLLLLASHEHERYREIQALVATGDHTQVQAARMILGCTCEALSEAVLGEWKLPDAIVRAQRAPVDGVLKAPQNRAEWMRQVCAFCEDVARLLGRTADPAGTPEAAALLRRYGAALAIDDSTLSELFDNVAQELAALLHSLGVQPAPRRERRDQHDGKDGTGLPNVLMLATLGAGDAEEQGCHPSGKPRNARDLLLAGVQEATQMRASGLHTFSDVILSALDTLNRALGCRFAAIVLKDARTGQYRARLARGLEQGPSLDGCAFPAAPAAGTPPDIFRLALDNDADLVIADARSPKIRDLLPAWHKAMLPDARSFIVLPLVVGKVQLGLFYADRTETAPEGIAPDETALIKALKGQVLMALTPAAAV
jgi:HD-like signal output (HDOD) protein